MPGAAKGTETHALSSGLELHFFPQVRPSPEKNTKEKKHMRKARVQIPSHISSLNKNILAETRNGAVWHCQKK